MADYLDLGDGLVVSEDGEIVDSAGINDTLAFIARKRHEAHVQEKNWHDYKRVLDAVLLKQQSEKRITYGDLVINITSGTYPSFDRERFGEAFLEIEPSREELRLMVLAAKDFDRAALPEVIAATYDAFVETKAKRPWVLSSLARKLAPKVKVASGD